MDLDEEKVAPKTKQIGLTIETRLYKKVTDKRLKKGVALSDIIRDLLDAWASGKIKLTKNI